MTKTESLMNRRVNRRSLLQKGGLAAGAVTVGSALGVGEKLAFGQGSDQLTKGDTAILRFLAAAEIPESDLWTQYAELGGIGNNSPIEIDPNQSLNNYQIALSNLDSDGPQYITSNTLDEESHAAFLNAYLVSKGAEPKLSGKRPHPSNCECGRLSFWLYRAGWVEPLCDSQPESQQLGSLEDHARYWRG
jgi:hypothetical protein